MDNGLILFIVPIAKLNQVSFEKDNRDNMKIKSTKNIKNQDKKIMHI